MQIVEESGEAQLTEIVRGVPMSVVFADGEAIEAVREGRASALELVPPFHVSDDDVYLVLPDDVGLELVDMFRDGDLDLLEESMRDGLVVLGSVEHETRGKVMLEVERAQRASDVLAALPYTETIGYGRGVDPTPFLNDMPHVRVTMASGLVDDDGLEAILAASERAGVSWSVPEKQKKIGHVDPTFAWSRRGVGGAVGIEMALFQEYEELVAVLRPALLAPLHRL